MRAAAIFSHDVLDKQVGCCSESTRLRFYLEIFNYDSICVTLNSSFYLILRCIMFCLFGHDVLENNSYWNNISISQRLVEFLRRQFRG